MNTFLRINCVTIYVLAMLGLFVALPFGATSILQNIAIIMLCVHLLEAVFAFKSVKLYKGSLAASIVLTLLFGLLHWLPLAKLRAHEASAR